MQINIELIIRVEEDLQVWCVKLFIRTAGYNLDKPGFGWVKYSTHQGP